MADLSTTPPVKKGGWPKGKPRGARTAPLRGPLHEPVQEQIRDGAAVVRGRGGEMLTRKRTTLSDEFHIPPEIVPENWTYQWNLLEVYGQPQVHNRIAMQEGGWRPVPCGRHPGRFMPNGTPPESAIIRGGLILEERPEELTQEARNEELSKATGLMRDSQQGLGLTQKMPDGFDRNNSSLKRMERQGTSRTIAPAHDAPRPRLPIGE